MSLQRETWGQQWGLFMQKLTKWTLAPPNQAPCILQRSALLVNFPQNEMSWQQKCQAIICIGVVYKANYENPIVLEQKDFPHPR